ncbi:site-specific DNA-methyltransferase [Patescibacteria group bacterium]|nr:site-specific DNA-methyltransferase [Patescibacteria group bacterium]MBU1519372.1 site-specific DNA-methyltransferase [Patescibacteria group bacterium]MBU2416803.1 site-specific DNA-methyltransferase [Patescibacteria group bacterium]MBU2460881.1 site-specific DNA-methyltransferase [Patescibacteria group bacterium]
MSNKLNLTDNEKRDIIKYLESGKPLPEKYRFLLFDTDKEVELLWNGKTDEVESMVLPFQAIEHIDEPRSEEKITAQTTLFDTSGRQIKGWSNKLIWGDNKLILSSLKNGPLRKQIEAEGGLKLIYIDPPFDVGADFSMNIEIGEDTFTKKPSVIEEIAFRDTWGKGMDSFIAMIYERLKLMHGLLADDGSIYVHCDYRVNSYMRLVLDEIFGKNNFLNEITWRRAYSHNDGNKLGIITDTIFYYSKSDKYKYNKVFTERTDAQTEKEYSNIDESTGKRYKSVSMNAAGQGAPRKFGDKGILSPPKGTHWRWSQERIDQAIKDDIIFFSSNGTPRYKQFSENIEGKQIQNLWADFMAISSQAQERLDYPTQKPEELIERILKISSNENDLIADFFCGSGTTLAVAEKLGRKWIGSDLGRFSIHTTRKRMIGVQRELKKAGKDFRAFEILNIGKYEREKFLTVNENLREEEKRIQRVNKEKEFIKLILSAYKAEPVDSFNTFVGKKRDRLVAVGSIDTPITNDFLEKIISECREKKITKADVLGFDYEMGLDFESAKKLGIDVQFKVIPREVFDKKAVEKGQVKFYDVAYIEVKPIIRGRGNSKEVAIELTDFSVFYNQDNTGEVEEKLQSGGNKIIIENGQVIKISKDKETNIIEKEVLTKKWTDWIDYWSVDFEFESKKEIVRVVDEKTGKEKEEWTGSYIFENEWQSFRTKKDRSLELTSAFKDAQKGKMKIAIKVIDIFGNDTTKVIEVNI